MFEIIEKYDKSDKICQLLLKDLRVGQIMSTFWDYRFWHEKKYNDFKGLDPGFFSIFRRTGTRIAV